MSEGVSSKQGQPETNAEQQLNKMLVCSTPHHVCVVRAGERGRKRERERERAREREGGGEGGRERGGGRGSESGSERGSEGAGQGKRGRGG